MTNSLNHGYSVSELRDRITVTLDLSCDVGRHAAFLRSLNDPVLNRMSQRQHGAESIIDLNVIL